jgi:hypothetical protein
MNIIASRRESMRICSRCKKPILRAHRWRHVHYLFLWFWTRARVEHRDCQHPYEIHKHVTRLKGEVALPFPQTGEAV